MLAWLTKWYGEKNRFLYLLKNSGITGLSGSDIPTFLKYSTNKKIDYLIVNGVECEPYITADAAMMEKYTKELIIGTDYTKGPIFVIRPLGTTLNKVTPQNKSVNVTWKRQAKKMSVKRITGYQIQLSTSKKFNYCNTKTVTVKGYKNTSKVVKKLKSKKKYYVRIRTYKVVNGKKVYSKWSKVKSVKTK